jgi:Tol biopolymer transport system component
LSTIWLVDAIGRQPPVQLTQPGDPAGTHFSPRWLDDSRHLLFASSASTASGGGTSLWNVEINTHERQRVVKDRHLSADYVVVPGGRAVYFVASDADTIWWMPLGANGTWKADPQPTGLAVGASQIAHLTISADGRRLGWTGLEVSVQVWTAGGQAAAQARPDPTPLVQGLGVWYGSPAPASDGRIAFVSERSGANLDLFLIAPPAPMRQLTVDRANHGGAQWMPGERELSYFTELPEGLGFAALDVESSRTRPLFLLSDVPHPPGASQPSTASPGTNVAFSPDYSKLALAIVKDGTLNIWVAGLRQLRPDGTLSQFSFEKDGGSYPAWSKDGRWLAYQCHSGSDTNVCVMKADGTGRVQLTHEPGQSWVGGWKADNETVLFAAERNGVWNVQSVSRTTGDIRPLTRFTLPLGHVRYPRWDAARDRVVFQRGQTTGRLWTVDLPPPAYSSTR